MSEVWSGVNPVLLPDVCAQGRSSDRTYRCRAEGSRGAGEEAGRVDPKLYAAGSPDV